MNEKNNGFTHLINAIWFRDLTLTKDLLSRGADINIADPLGHTALHYAAEKSDEIFLKTLLETERATLSTLVRALKMVKNRDHLPLIEAEIEKLKMG